MKVEVSGNDQQWNGSVQEKMPMSHLGANFGSRLLLVSRVKWKWGGGSHQ